MQLIHRLSTLALFLALMVLNTSRAQAQVPATQPASDLPAQSQPAKSAPVEIHATDEQPTPPRPAGVTAAPPAPAARPKPVPSAPAPATTVVRRPLYEKVRAKQFFLGLGFSFGLFAPPDVNSYMEGWQDSLGTTMSQSGFTGMFLNLIPRIAVTYKPLKYVEVQAVGEIAWGPKIISSNVESKVFSFVRFSPGIVGSFHLPVGQHGKSIYAGVGFIYHWMVFEDFSADTPGLRVEAGFELYTSKTMIELFAAFDYAKADAGAPIGYGDNASMILNYTGVMLGFNIHFGLF